MNDLVERVARFFLEPADGAVGSRLSGAQSTAASRAVAIPEPLAILLCPPERAEALACAAALSLAAAAKAPVALAAVWTGTDSSGRPRLATRSARRLAAKLEARGLPARAAGRLAVLDLPADGAEAAAAVNDAVAAARGPAAVALGGARCEATDRLLFAADAVSVIASPGRDPAAALLGELVEDSLPVRAGFADAHPGPVATLLVTSGLAVTPSLARSLEGRPR